MSPEVVRANCRALSIAVYSPVRALLPYCQPGRGTPIALEGNFVPGSDVYVSDGKSAHSETQSGS